MPLQLVEKRKSFGMFWKSWRLLISWRTSWSMNLDPIVFSKKTPPPRLIRGLKSNITNPVSLLRWFMCCRLFNLFFFWRISTWVQVSTFWWIPGHSLNYSKASFFVFASFAYCWVLDAALLALFPCFLFHVGILSSSLVFLLLTRSILCSPYEVLLLIPSC